MSETTPVISDLDRRYVDFLLRKATINGDCIECHFKPKSDGYVRIDRIGYAHRIVWEGINGIIPAGKIILHSCDNRRCININHLSVGSHQDNTQDMITKGRHKYGNSGIANRIVDKKTFSKMLAMQALNYSQREIAANLGLSQSCVGNHLNGRRTQI